MNGGYQVREFASLAGVTVRALHHYDRLAVLRPKRSESGYRLYSLRDLERLEQIVALKFLGLPLKDIKALLDREARRLPEVLRAQRLALEEKRRDLERAIHAIEDAERGIASGKPADVRVLTKIIEVIEMQDNPEFTKKYYSEGAQAKLAERRKEWKPEMQAEVTRAWSDLFHDVEEALNEDPRSEKAQVLAARWRELVEGFTGGDPDVSGGLGKAWADRENWPGGMKEQSAPFANPKIWAFIQKAMASRQG
jgi:MerR family transcriptional regulator, thiopeptide resistance regulator